MATIGSGKERRSDGVAYFKNGETVGLHDSHLPQAWIMRAKGAMDVAAVTASTPAQPHPASEVQPFGSEVDETRYMGVNLTEWRAEKAAEYAKSYEQKAA